MRPLIEYPDDEIAEIVTGQRDETRIRVRLPHGANVFVVDPSSHLCVEHVDTIERLCDLVLALLARAPREAA